MIAKTRFAGGCLCGAVRYEVDVCAECGATLFWERDGDGDISIAAGTLDAPTGLKTTQQIYVADAGDSYQVDPGVPIRRP